MTSPTIESLQPAMENISITNENNKNVSKVADTNFDPKWGLPLEEVYKLALRFYKEKDGTKAVQLSYKDRIKLVAYTKQVLYGKYRTDVSPEVGFLDVVGNDRRQAWMSLGDMSRSEAMSEFIKYIDQLCPLFMPYVDAHKAEKEEQLQKQKEEEERMRREEEEKERKQLEDEVRRRQEDERSRQIQQEMAIRAALNQQTDVQFKQYAEQQYPGNKEQQEALIVQLQEQHFQQYMQQVYQQQLLHQQQQQQQLQNMTDTTQTQQQLPPQTVQGGNAPGGQEVTQVAQAVTGNGIDPMTAHGAQVIQNNITDAHIKNIPADGEEETEQNLPPIAAASMWTRKDVKEFKESIRKDPDSLIKVGSGETITVRVPTHEDGTCLFWEFATDNYDIGFGVYFEWTIAPNNQVSVHVSESSDEDELDDEEGESRGGDGDVERGKKSENRPPTDEIIPVYRRDCHQEVYCGSHMYPGRGVYLLKFDNSYSLWRSKCLYYRVYYTR